MSYHKRNTGLISAIIIFLTFFWFIMYNTSNQHVTEPSDSTHSNLDRKNQHEFNSICSQADRKRLLRESCERNKEERELMGVFLIDDIHKVVYCYTAKIASTTMRAIMLNITTAGQLHINDVAQFHREFHSKYSNIPGMSMQHFNGEIPRDKFINYTKFFIVRHPLSRLVSAYYDKMQGQDIAFLNFAYNVHRRYRQGVDDNRVKVLPTFREFIRMVIAKNYTYKNIDDDYVRRFRHICHWENINYCDPCNIEYDYILKQETLDVELEQFISNVYGNEALKYIHNKYLNTGNNYNSMLGRSHRLHPEFEKLSTEELRLVVLKYKNELQYFGYTFENNEAKCDDTCSGNRC